MANGFWRIGLDNTKRLSINGSAVYILNNPSIPKENYDSVHGTLTLPKPIIIDIGMWKDVSGNDIELLMPIIATDVSGNHVTFPSDSVLSNYSITFNPMDATLSTFGFAFEAK